MAAGADDLDNASEMTQKFTDSAIEGVRQAAAPQQRQRPDGSWPTTECDCGEAIPKARLLLGRIRCVDCQQALENLSRSRG